MPPQITLCDIIEPLGVPYMYVSNTTCEVLNSKVLLHVVQLGAIVGIYKTIKTSKS